MDVMDVYIRFEENITDEDSYNLKQLARLIEDECDLSVKIEKGEAYTGVRDGGLAIGIALTSLALAALQTLISVLQYWESKQPEYSLSITFNHRNKARKLLIRNASASDIQAVVSQLKAESYLDYVEVQISRKR